MRSVLRGGGMRSSRGEGGVVLLVRLGRWVRWGGG